MLTSHNDDTIRRPAHELVEYLKQQILNTNTFHGQIASTPMKDRKDMKIVKKYVTRPSSSRDMKTFDIKKFKRECPDFWTRCVR